MYYNSRVVIIINESTMTIHGIKVDTPAPATDAVSNSLCASKSTSASDSTPDPESDSTPDPESDSKPDPESDSKPDSQFDFDIPSTYVSSADGLTLRIVSNVFIYYN